MLKRITIALTFFCLTSFSLFAQTLTNITPDTVEQGQTLTMSITGQNTNFSQATHTSWLTRGVDAIVPTINSIQSTSLLNSIYAIPGSAAVGFWDVHAQDNRGEYVKSDGVFIDMFVGLDPTGHLIKNTVKMAPNPVVDDFVLSYTLDRKAAVAIDIMDLHGRLVARLLADQQAPGEHRESLSLDGLGLASGVFLVVLRVDDMAFATRATHL